jgi:hyperosmotically inducible protein
MPLGRLLVTVGVLALLATGCRTAAVIDPAAIGDAQTAARVKTALVNDPDLGVRAIEVTVSRGVARLSGRVRSQAEIDRAVALAGGVPGVSSVESALRLGADPVPGPASTSAPAGLPGEIDAFELETNPGLLAVGASVGWSRPTSEALHSRTSVGPLVRIGSGRGLGVAAGFDWFKADFATSHAQTASVARVTVRPIMAGLSYTFAARRISVSPGVIGGLALNSLTITETGTADHALAVEVDNSLAWRPGVSVWFDASRRVAVNVSAGYLMTGLDLTVLDGGRLSKRHTSGSTVMLRGGLAYKVF